MPFSKTHKKKRQPPLHQRIFYSKPCQTVLSRMIKMALTFLFSLLRIDIKGQEHLTKESPLIIAFWHNRILLAPLLRKIIPSRPLSIVVSNSRDGHLLASFGKSYKEVSVISVAHNKRHQALLAMCEVLEKNESIVLITPDGPRGPKYQVKPGVIYGAKKSGAKIIPMHWHPTK
ncbi:MAG: DUF374 domain-containing protein, partial [Verrucomicrobia bacterium]|nr:DUF374 domain-containing protein [Verrucomicrobiota bacterium]